MSFYIAVKLWSIKEKDTSAENHWGRYLIFRLDFFK